MIRSACAALILLLVGLTANVAAPAWACGCGAYIPDTAGPAVVNERALLAWNGHREDILMSLNVRGQSNTAAWIMPVPSAADVTLGEESVFDELAQLTAPRIEYRDSWWPSFGWLRGFAGAGGLVSAAAPGHHVDVLSSQRIGPFDVTRLAADDPTALSAWLTSKGFAHPAGLDRNLAPYLADGWQVVAIRLAPDASGATLTGALQPLRLSFDADRAVYPMRLSQSAKTPQSVDLYVLAEHRMDPTSVPVPGDDPTLQFAGHLGPDAVSGDLAPFVGDGAFLTRWTNEIGTPASISGDYVFVATANDTPYQQVIYRERDRGDLTGLALVALVPVLCAGVTALIAVRILRSRRQAR
ncbi:MULTISPECIES: DUF2330 domain-containing protein [unclassified Mycolicibacterium]|uniref:DUF2330 domain-containing protein n=1 Tax=unclassified Mycolicibacterium TaxID=2636767 RepID=UPI002ED86C86